MILAALCGAAFGLAAIAAWRAAVPATPSLEAALARAGRSAQPDPGGHQHLRGRAGRLGVAMLRSAGADIGPAARADLALLERPVEDHVADKVIAALAGLLLPWVWWTLAATALGVTAAPILPFLAAGGLGVAGWLLPDVALRGEAARRRREFTQSLSAFLDLVVIALAGGAGIESALDDASRIGRSDAFGRIAETLTGARLRSESPWEALAVLGASVDVPELVELGATVSLAGTEGSRVRQTLTAKAAAMRERDLAEEEARAQSATERMAVPTVMLMAGFIVLVGYPAVRAVTNGL